MLNVKGYDPFSTIFLLLLQKVKITFILSHLRKPFLSGHFVVSVLMPVLIIYLYVVPVLVLVLVLVLRKIFLQFSFTGTQIKIASTEIILVLVLRTGTTLT